MIELAGAVGGIVGGLFRLAPEAIKYFDRKNDRQHELAMLNVQAEVEKTRGAFKLQEIGAQREAANDAAIMGAYQAAISAQAMSDQAAGGWAASLSASVRPILTYGFCGTYLLMTIVVAGEMLMRGNDLADVAKYVLTADFIALTSGIVSFWFVNRTLERRGL